MLQSEQHISFPWPEEPQLASNYRDFGALWLLYRPQAGMGRCCGLHSRWPLLQVRRYRPWIFTSIPLPSSIPI